MTIQEAAKQYEAEHVKTYQGKSAAVFNPHNKPLEELPIIYGFNNGGSKTWPYGVLLSEDGAILGGHTCSAESYMLGDLGILEGFRPDRHEGFQKHYPDGYKMEFVSHANVLSHEGLCAAHTLYQAIQEAAKQTNH